VEQFAIGGQENVTDYWTFHQPAEDGVVCMELLRISAAVITFVFKALRVQNTVTELNGTDVSC